jgi:hypothetical protein
VPGQWCLTKKGNVAEIPHADRWRKAFAKRKRDLWRRSGREMEKYVPGEEEEENSG